MTERGFTPRTKPAEKPKPPGELAELFNTAVFVALIPVGIACAIIFNNEEGPKI